jgi:predicted AlkP superfamily pyrophosphatase or phosphodiesterase
MACDGFEMEKCMIMRFALLAATLLPAALLSACAAAQPVTKPKLVVAISVDQFSADLFAEYRAHFTGGLKRLSQGAVFPNGYQSHAASETCPGHSTILTGGHPARTGVIANSWLDQSIARADKTVYCAEDVTLGATSRAGDYVPSVVHLKIPTLGDRMKAADPRTRVVSVAGKDRAAIMLGGHKTDALWFIRPGDTPRFETLRGAAASPIADRANERLAASLGKAVAAMPLSPVCRARSRAIGISGVKEVGTGRFARRAGDTAPFRASPEADRAVLDLASDLTTSMKLGQGDAVDLIAIGLSATDYVGHGFGTGGSEMCLQLQALDTMLERFFAQLDRTGVDYVVVLTADHGGHDTPERSREQALTEAARIAPTLSSEMIGKALAAGGIAPEGALRGDVSDLYFDAALSAEQRAKILPWALKLIRGKPQVAAAFSAAEIAATQVATTPPESWTLAERLRASFDPARSADILVILKPHIIPITGAAAARGSIATHGSAWDYDRRVPILFWRKGITPFEQPNSVETVDIAPTLAAFVGVQIPSNEIDGRCLDINGGALDTCR